MTRYIVTVEKKGLRTTELAKALRSFGPECEYDIQDGALPTSQAGRFAVAMTQIGQAKEEAENLRGELDSWRESLPDTQQESEKAEQLEDAISQLEEFIAACEQAEGVEIEFPGMIG